MLNHSLFIVWKPEYDLGIPIIDEQHKGIVSTINSLFYAMQCKHGEHVLKSVINMVTEYTHIHFDVEEDLLNKAEFSDFKKHKEWHNELKRALANVGPKSLWDHSPKEFLEFLKNWWIDHICEKDRIFRDYYLALEESKEA